MLRCSGAKRFESSTASSSEAVTMIALLRRMALRAMGAVGRNLAVVVDQGVKENKFKES